MTQTDTNHIQRPPPASSLSYAKKGWRLQPYAALRSHRGTDDKKKKACHGAATLTGSRHTFYQRAHWSIYNHRHGERRRWEGAVEDGRMKGRMGEGSTFTLLRCVKPVVQTGGERDRWVWWWNLCLQIVPQNGNRAVCFLLWVRQWDSETVRQWVCWRWGCKLLHGPQAARKRETHAKTSGKDWTPLPRPSSPYKGVGDTFIPLPSTSSFPSPFFGRGERRTIVAFYDPSVTQPHAYRQRVVRIVCKIKACFVHKTLLPCIYLPICK